ncbi:uncharacterized protein J4E88_006541 [Alternaria novae-zelandiae]|uniref:uncharacterized protein n=1 Tax=Alternaria novae-zelandiae TaxID=430562 RepID=UPI0020C22628|nr:uncharacterized protein J4E88_006541 [Alternaria novae-zelandiae]KAI4678023.1 hypothetical protein J4E88_006541 [Alternaria novae-zelandiae]
MLQRDVIHLPEFIATPHEFKLSQSITGFLPQEWCYAPGVRSRMVPFGHHLIWFNPAVPTTELLPDGTDASQSPGGPWVRRMWAGGSIQVRPDEYYDRNRGFRVEFPMSGTEHIKHVRLHGEGDTAKIFVTIERRFARVDIVGRAYNAKHGKLGKNGGKKLKTYLEQQLRDGDDWGDSIVKEERNLVFFKERPAAELEAVKAGQMAAVKYLQPPGKPDFSHALTPDRALLFRFSALTFNAHRIHLDPEYARNVEGHRNLLVHGPLSLLLMLKTISHYVYAQTGGKHDLESIEYRNLAPLYCDEEMRICGLEKKKLQHGSIYDVWIEGPTGGVAVKGTVYTTVKNPKPKPLGPGSRRPDITALNAAAKKTPKAQGSDQDHVASENKRPPQDSPVPAEPPTSSEPVSQPQGETPNKSDPSETTSQPSSREVNSPTAQTTSRASRRKRASNTTAYNFISLPPSKAPSARVVDSYKPVKPTISIRSREIIRRARRRAPKEIHVKPIPLVRRFDATPYTPDPVRTASRHSRYLREGARKIEKPSVRFVAEQLSERAALRKRIGFRYVHR